MFQLLFRRRIVFRIVLGVGCVLIGVPQVLGQRHVKRENLREQVNRQIKTTLDQLELDHQYAEAEKTLAALFDRVVAFGRVAEADLFREVGLALRMVRQLGDAAADERDSLLAFLRANPQLAANMAFLFQPADEDAAEVYSALSQLRKVREEQLEKNATLTAAMCVVHDRMAARSATAGAPTASPLELFDYYTRNERQFPLRPLADVPPELLVYVVDVKAGIDELAWAAERLGDIPLDGLFQRLLLAPRPPFVVPPPPPVAASTGPQRFEDILKTGGSDQERAYLVSVVGKAIGIPNVSVTLEVEKLSYSWVGFLDTRGRRAWWNFDIARLVIPPMLYEVGGEIMNPQTNRKITIQTLSLLAGLLTLNPEDKQAAIAMVDGVQRLVELETLGEEFNPPPLDESRTSRRPPRPRQTDIKGQLDLLQMAVDVSNGLYAPAWKTVSELARAGKLDGVQIRRWVELVNRTCGREYSDFTLELVRQMVATVPEVEGQNELWEITFHTFQTVRPDLAADVRISQGEMWEKAGDYTQALECYQDVVRRYANTGPFIVKALDKAERLLVQTGQLDAVADLYGQAWEQIGWPPKSDQAVKESTTWFKVGMMYADRLDKAGRTDVARQIRLRLTVH